MFWSHIYAKEASRVQVSHLLTRDSYFDVTVLVQQCTACNILFQVIL